MSGNIAAVVVLFEPSDAVAANAQSYASDVDVLIAVDNSPAPVLAVTRSLERHPRFVYEARPENAGMAGALNLAADRAMSMGCEFLLTMDQDSVAPDGMVRRLATVLDSDPAIGMAGPFHLDRNAPDAVPSQGLEDVTTLMTSGCLLRLDAFRATGPFREDFFIDYVDDEYSLRLQEKGYRVVRAGDVALEHAQGEKTTRSFFGRTVRPTHHAPERFYYQCRNRVYLRRLHGARFPAYLRYERKLHMGRLTKMFLYEHNRIRKLQMVVRGILAAWRGETGPLRSR